MPYDLTAWPLPSDVCTELSARGITLDTSFMTDRIRLAVAAIGAKAEHDCQRQFVATTETRCFDGSGAGEMEVDEFISITSVKVVGYLAAPNIQIANPYGVSSRGKASTRIQIFQGSLPAYGRIWLDTFPEGRSNIQVEAVWGYAAAIPADMWLAVLDAATQNLARANEYSPNGPLKAWHEGAVAEEYEALTQAEFAQYPLLNAAIEKYRRPTGTRLHRRTRRMV